jgi:hypothetical protein
MNYRELQEFVCEGARACCNDMNAPDEDWPAYAFLLNTKGDMAVVELPPEKSHWVPLLTDMISELGVRKLGLVSSAWVVKFELPDEFEGDLDEFLVSEAERSRSHADRQEVVIASIFDEERVEGWVAAVTRSEDAPPVLGEWDEWGDSSTSSFEGGLVDSIRLALR